MKKFKAVLFACIIASIAGCFCDDCTYKEDKLPAYANKSSETVKIISFVGEYTLDWTGLDKRYEKIIADGDTLHYTAEGAEGTWYVPYGNGCGFVSYGDCDKPIRMELHFLNESQKCLIFDGPIEHDGIDMRSWDSYKKGNEISDWADFWVGVEYVYTITPDHRDMARGEDCPSSEDD